MLIAFSLKIFSNETENFAFKIVENANKSKRNDIMSNFILSSSIREFYYSLPSLPLCVSRSIFMEISGIGKEENEGTEEENEGGIARRRFCFL